MKSTLLTSLAISALSMMAPSVTHAEVTCAFTPTSGSTVHDLKTIDITTNVMIDEVFTSKVYLTNSANEKTPCTSATILTTDYNNYMRGATLTFNATEAGSYTLTIEEGAIKPWSETDGTNTTVTAQYTIDPSVPAETIFTKYTLTPSGEKTLANLGDVRISFPKISYLDNIVVNSESVKKITLSGNGNEYHCVGVNGGYGSYTLSFNKDGAATNGEKISTPGEYTLSVPAGVWNNGYDPIKNPDEYIESIAISAKYTVSDNIDYDYSASPENGKTLTIPEYGDISISLSILDASEVKLEPKSPGADWSVTLGGTKLTPADKVTEGENTYYMYTAGTNIYIRISKSLVKETSEIRITAPKGAFTVDGLSSPAIDYTVTYNPPKVFTYRFTPRDGARYPSLNTVKVEFTNAESIEKEYFCWDNSASLVSSDNVTSKSKTIDISTDGSHPSAIFTFDQALSPGTYTFSFPAKNLKLDGEGSPELKATFILDPDAPLYEGLSTPYLETFDTSDSFEGFTVINANGDKKMDGSEEEWLWVESERNDIKVQEAVVGGDSKDDWLISPAIVMLKGNTYKVSLHARPFALWSESFEVKIGSYPSAEDMNETLLETIFLADALSESDFHAYFTPKESGAYHIGIHANTEKEGWALMIDNLAVSDPIDKNVPAAVTEVSITTDPDNQRKADIVFKSPSTNVGGEKLESLTKIEIIRGGEVIKTFDSPAVDTKLDYKDVLPEAGDFTYTIIPYNANGEGLVYTTTVFIGTRKPSYPTNVKVRETENAGEVTITWDAPTTDVDGNAINSDNITYYIEKRREVNGELIQTLIQRYIKGTSFTYQAASPEDPQEFISFGVYAESDGGISYGSETRLIPLGKPYAAPYKESFDTRTISCIAVATTAGKGSWGIYGEAEGKIEAADKDDFYAGMAGTEEGDAAILYTGKIDLSTLTSPVLSFSVYNFGDTDGEKYTNDLEVSVATDNEFKPIDKFAIYDRCNGKEGWNCITIPLESFNEKTIQLGFTATSKSHTHVFLDVIEVKEDDTSVERLSIAGTVTVGNGSIIIDNPATEPVGVFSIDGKAVYTGHDAHISLDVPADIYAVRIGSRSLKVIVK